MNKVTIKVDKIRSYQTLVNKRGHGSYRTKEYKAYIAEISYQLSSLKALERNASIMLKITFNCKHKTVGDIDNITKPIQDILELSGKINNDRQIHELHAKKTFGHDENTIEIELEERG